MRTLAVLGVLLAIATGCGGAREDRAGGHTSKPLTLSLAYPLGDALEIDPLVEAVSKLSAGSLRIDVKDRWRDRRLDFETRLIEDVRAGKTDLGVAGSRAWDTVGVPSLTALVAPLLIDSYSLERRVVTSELSRGLLARLRPLGLVGIGVLPGMMRRPLGAKRPLLRPADFAGLTIGTQQSNVADATLRALGAEPVRIAASQIPDLGRLGGLEQRAGAISGNLSDARGQFLTANVELWPRPFVVFANARRFASLTDDQRRILQAAVASVIPSQIALDRTDDRDSSGILCRRGLLRFATASPADLAALRRAVRPVYARLERDPATRRAIHAIERLKRQVGAPPDVLPRCTTTERRAAASRTPLDGVYEMTTKAAQGGIDQLAENWGKWIFVFDRGRFADTQENRLACTWGYGTVTVRGARMSWSFTDGGGIAPNNAQNKPGEFFVFGWSRFRDTVTVTPVPGAISPSNFRSKPWRLISTTPSRKYFSRRCPPPAAALLK